MKSTEFKTGHRQKKRRQAIISCWELQDAFMDQCMAWQGMACIDITWIKPFTMPPSPPPSRLAFPTKLTPISLIFASYIVTERSFFFLSFPCTCMIFFHYRNFYSLKWSNDWINIPTALRTPVLYHNIYIYITPPEVIN